MSEMYEEHFQFDLQKFKDAVHYVVQFASKEFGSDALGNVKLHKCLYYADMLHYLDTMQPLTGAEYQRQQFGPTARFLSKALKILDGENRVKTEVVNYYGYGKKHYASLSEISTNRLSKSERELLEHVTRFVCNKTASEISDFSHDLVWSSVPMGSRIPYFAALAMFPAEFSDEDIEDAKAETKELYPMIREMVLAGDNR